MYFGAVLHRAKSLRLCRELPGFYLLPQRFFGVEFLCLAKFLLTVWPFPTHLNPNLALACALRRQSHQVAFYSGSVASSLIATEGFRFFCFQNVDWERVERVVNAIVSPKKNGPRSGGLWRQFLVETIPGQLQDLDSVLGEWQPDVLVCDIAMWGPILILHESRRLPVAVLSHVSA
jgi:hypothetical protein